MRSPRRHTALVAAAAALVLSGGVAVGSATASTPPSSVAAAAAPTVTNTSSGGVAATDAPLKVRIGAPVQKLRVTVVTTSPMDATSVSLKDRRGSSIATVTSTTAEPGRPGVQKPVIAIEGKKLTHWGQHTWDVRGWRTSDGSCTLVDRPVSTDVRAHSMLGATYSRTGSTVTVKASLRAWGTNVDRYAAWSGRPVSIQRWDGGAWRQVAGVTTDRNGNVTTKVSLPAKSQVRLVTGDVSTIWGATSATSTV